MRIFVRKFVDRSVKPCFFNDLGLFRGGDRICVAIVTQDPRDVRTGPATGRPDPAWRLELIHTIVMLISHLEL
jgi:hypothetical protein